MFGSSVVRRIFLHGAAFFLAWPLASTVAATIDLKSQPMTSRLPWADTFIMLARALPQLSSEWLVAGLLGAAGSVALFSALSWRRGRENAPVLGLVAEPFLLMAAVAAGIATEYPAVLSHPFLRSLRPLSVRSAILILVLLAAALFFLLGTRLGGPARGAVWLGASLSLIALTAFASRIPAARRHGAPARRSIALLGIDSLSQSDDLEPMRSLARDHGGTFFTRAVTTGVVTNAVWSSILQHRPVSEIGNWTIFLATDWRTVPYSLVREAHRSGWTTVSYFSDQFTSYVGDDAGFDVDRSGPRGWFQLATATLKQDSIFLAAVLPRLPVLPGAQTPRNQSGTFAFDVGAELDDFFRCPEGVDRCFSAGHLDSLHQPLYPTLDELTPAERGLVLRSPVASVEDLSFDWRYPAIEGDSLGLYAWKVRHVQDLVRRAVERTGYLDPSRGNRLVVFSDHGSRKDLTAQNLGNPTYWNVLLATFGTARADPSRPISLLAIPALLGFPDPTRVGPDAPAVEYADVDDKDVAALRPYFSSDGRIFLDPDAIARIRPRMERVQPFLPAAGDSDRLSAGDRPDIARSSRSNR
ncbi:MAG: hypothetical protein ACRD16_15365 [Thermoanaerobaculia bacterium]